MAGAFPETYKRFMNGATEDVWIETGTYNGESVRRAMHFGFKEIHTIEINQVSFDVLPENKPDVCSDKRVTRYLGSSRRLLPSIIDTVRDRHVVFWLDAHYAGQSQKDRDEVSECPLMDELQAIVSTSWKHQPLVIIDDANMFIDALWNSDHDRGAFTRSHWPGEQQIVDMLQGWQHYEAENIFYFYQ